MSEPAQSQNQSDQSQTQTIAPPAPKTDPAFVPSPLQQGPAGEKAPWQTDEFKAKIAAAGFPGSPQTDEAWLIALYKFSGGTMPEPKAVEEPQPAYEPSQEPQPNPS
jgi:hypothetical protein